MKKLHITLIVLLASMRVSAQVNLIQQWSWTLTPYVCNAEIQELPRFLLENTTSDTVVVSSVTVSIKDTSLAADSFFFKKNGQWIGTCYSNNNTLGIHQVLLPFESKGLDLFCKTKTMAPVNASLEISFIETNWQKKGNSTLYSTSTPAVMEIRISDCNPRIRINPFAYTGSMSKVDTVCANNSIGTDVYLLNLNSAVKTVEWFVNDTIAPKTGFSHTSWPYQLWPIHLTQGTIKITAKVTDDLGRIGLDSLSFTVLPAPTLKVKASAKTFCSGEFVEIACDTSGLTSWEFNYEQEDSLFVFPIHASGTYNIRGTAPNGCTADTNITIFELPAPSQQSISFNKWIASASLQADSFSWSYGITPTVSPLANSNNIYVDATNAGYYQVTAFNTYGCSAISPIKYHDGWTTPDSTPKVQLIVSSPRVGLTACSNDSVIAMRDIKLALAPIKSEMWYLNGVKMPFDKSQLHAQFKFQIPLIGTEVKILVEIIDTLNHRAADSITIHILPTPQTHVILSNTTFCEGTQITAHGDTTGLTTWRWNNAHSLDTFIISTAGTYTYHTVGKNGCSMDTAFTVMSRPNPPTPIITFNTWIASADLQADSFSWSYGAMPSPTMIPNANSIYTDASKAGYYQVTVFNKYGCSAVSSITHYNGWTAPDSMPHVRLILSSPRIGLTVCDKDSVMVMREIKTTMSPIQTETWYLNDTIIPFALHQLHAGMQFKLPLQSAAVKIRIVVIDTANHTASDSFTLNVLKSPHTTITAPSLIMCEGEKITLSADTTGLQAWIWDGFHRGVEYDVYTSGIYEYHTVGQNGCTADTAFRITVLPKPQQPTVSMNDTMLWCNEYSPRYTWLSGTTALTTLQNEVTQFMKPQVSGFYRVQVKNNHGCAAVSAPVGFVYTAPQIPVDSTQIKIGSLTNIIGFRTCQNAFYPTLSTNIPPNDILYVQWKNSGVGVYNCMDMHMCKTVPDSIMLYPGVNIITIEILTTDGKRRGDYLNIVKLSAQKPTVSVITPEPFCVGNKLQFRVYGSPYESIIWSNGMITDTVSMETQSTSVYAKIIDADGCTAYSDTFTVKPSIVPTPTLAAVNCTLYSDIHATDGKFVWMQGVKHLDTTLENIYKVTEPGFYKVQYIAKNGCISELSDPVFTNCITTSAQVVEESTVSMYPNPFTSQITITSEIGARIIFISTTGQIAYEHTMQNSYEQFEPNLPSGIYVITIIKDDTIIGRQKLIKE